MQIDAPGKSVKGWWGGGNGTYYILNRPRTFALPPKSENGSTGDAQPSGRPTPGFAGREEKTRPAALPAEVPRKSATAPRSSARSHPSRMSSAQPGIRPTSWTNPIARTNRAAVRRRPGARVQGWNPRLCILQIDRLHFATDQIDRVKTMPWPPRSSWRRQPGSSPGTPSALPPAWRRPPA